jgi:hypothetical protein
MRRHILPFFIAFLIGNLPAAAQVPTSEPAPLRVSGPASAHRIFVALNGGYQASSVTFDDTRAESLHAETASWTADYNVEPGQSVDAAAGVRLWRNLAVTVGMSRFTESRAAAVSGEIPHPFFFNQPRSVSGETQALKHAERAVHIDAGWIISATDRLQLTLFGGPSFFSVERDLLENIEYADSYPYDDAAYSGAIIRSVSQSRIGLNAGADVSYFVTETIGFGAGVRFSRAQAELPSPATGNAVPVELGGAHASVGLRLRFGAMR